MNPIREPAPERTTPAVLVLGGGFIGAAVSRSLAEVGCPVTVLTRSEPSPATREVLAGSTVVVGDASDPRSVAALLADAQHVFYALGSSSPAQSALDPASDSAEVVPRLVRLLELLRLHPHVSLTFLSSGGAVYGHGPVGGQPISESFTPRPISSYGVIKLTCEKFVDMYSYAYGIAASTIRVANAYGPGQATDREQGLIARLMRCATTGEVVTLYGAHEAVRDYVYIDDIATVAARLVCTADLPKIVNLGSGVGHTVYDVVAMVREVTGCTIDARHLAARSFDVRSNVLDVSLLRSLVDFEPRDLRSGLVSTWEHLNAGAGTTRSAASS